MRKVPGTIPCRFQYECLCSHWHMVTKGTSEQMLWPLDGAEPAVLEIEFSDTVSDQSFVHM